MSGGTCAVMLVKDEADVIGYTVGYLAGQVDAIFVVDNGSTDGTRELLENHEFFDDRLWVSDDDEVGYYQADKMTALAEEVALRGYEWVVPCDADEVWYATDGRRLADFLAGLAPDVGFVSADLFNHLPTGADVSEQREPNPLRRITWRQREHGALPKVAARLRPGLEIRAGNHSAYAPGSAVTASGLCVRHFSWRSADQYVRKIANGARAYAATDLPASVGAHWRMFGSPDSPEFEERVADHFRRWFWVAVPSERSDLIDDPAPLGDDVRRQVVRQPLGSRVLPKEQTS